MQRPPQVTGKLELLSFPDTDLPCGPKLAKCSGPRFPYHQKSVVAAYM